MVEQLESRQLLSTAVLAYHGNDLASDGDNMTETSLTPANVNINSFGKMYTTALDGVAVAQPLYDPGVNITTGSYQGTHNVVFIADESDSLYAIDATNGTVLWKDSFLVAESALTATGASVSVSTVLSSDVNSSDTPIIGITGTPAIDPSINSLFVIAKTKQIVNNQSTTPHFVQTLYKVNLSSGAFSGAVIADTTFNTSVGESNYSSYTYNSGPFVLDPHGQGSGVVTAVVNGSSQKVDYFNALRSFSRVGVTLYNGNVYLGFASHGDNAPYHGWVLGYSESTLAATAVFSANPDGGDDGIWGGGGKIAVDSSGYMYVETGNGTFDTTLNSSGFPQYGDYGDSFLKIAVDPTTSVTNQNINGWGLKVADYFTPYNQNSLSGADQDIGSGSPMVLPASVGSVTVGSAVAPNLLVGSGKNGVIYLINTANMGHFSSTTDNVVQEVSNGVSGGGSYDTPSLYYNGSQAYILYAGKASMAQEYTIANGVINSVGTASTMSIGQFGSSIELSGNGASNGVAWLVDGGANAIRAYNPTNLSQEYYDSNQDSARDALGSANKFETLTVADGEVFAVSTNALQIYGLIAQPTSPPTAPTSLSASVVSNDSVNLNWTNTATNAFDYYIQEEPVGNNTWVQIGSVGSGVSTYQAVGLTPGTKYNFRVEASNSVGNSPWSNTATATTTNATTVPNFATGFATVTGEMTLNGSAKLANNTLELTDGNGGEASSAFTDNAVPVQGFTTTFAFQVSSASADGFTYTMQNQAVNAIGSGGGDLGYGGTPGITPSVCIKFDIYSNNGEGTDSTGLFVYGDPPEEPTGAYKVETSADMTASGVILTSGDPMSCTLGYNGTVLTEAVTDTKLGKTFTKTYTLNIPLYVGGPYAYVGFTGGTGGGAAVQQVQTWSYSAVGVAPYTPANLTVTPASGTELDLAWNEPYSTVTNYDVLELESGNYTQVAQVPGTLTNANITGLQNGTNYSFEVIAVNANGSSAATSPVAGTTPYPPADVSNLVASNVTSSGVTITWQNNATNATSIRLTRQLESDNSQYVGTLSATTTTYADSNLLPGREYDYEIAASNLAGPSDGVDVIVETIPAAPATPTAAVTGNSVTLNWAAYGHAVTGYNVYRGTTPGGEGTVPVASNVNATSYTDTGLTNGVTYYYKITAVDTGGEGPPSAEASAAVVYAPLTVSSPAAYLRLDPDGLHIDVWNNGAATGAPTQTLLSQVSSLSINGPAGADAVTVDFSNGNPFPASGLTVASAGTEAITLLGTPGGDSVSVGSSTIAFQAAFGSASIAYTNVGSIQFNGGTGSDTLTQTAQPGGTLGFAASTSQDSLVINAGTYTIPSGTSGINRVSLGSLTVAAGANVAVAPAASPANRTLLSIGTLSDSGQLDLGRNDMDVQSATIAAVGTLVQSGYDITAGGNWQGQGIVSSAAGSDTSRLTALGVIQNNQSGIPLFTAASPFDGVTPGAGDILVKYTLVGDANLDGKIDGSDYALIDGGDSTPLTGWYNGDFNYDGVVDGSDYALIDNSFNNQAAVPPAIAVVTAQVALPTVAKSNVAVVTSSVRPVAATNLPTPSFSKFTITSKTLVIGSVRPAATTLVQTPPPVAILQPSPFYQGSRKARSAEDSDPFQTI